MKIQALCDGLVCSQGSTVAASILSIPPSTSPLPGVCLWQRLSFPLLSSPRACVHVSVRALPPPASLCLLGGLQARRLGTGRRTRLSLPDVGVGWSDQDQVDLAPLHSGPIHTAPSHRRASNPQAASIPLASLSAHLDYQHLGVVVGGGKAGRALGTEGLSDANLKKPTKTPAGENGLCVKMYA
ncbi:unnamed protein product [Pleuronectes platessa]|uniref:Uncharacterized protein n=1 Tax=Pleuronectes platessa TaxID=8262 RepID=A0A9N7YPA5_PLEPL|nr:unnamed protein product [Pleuronectes platessa]